jgi:gas vesicle protein
MEPIDVTFLINSQEVAQESEKVKKEITTAADTAEKATAKASKKIREEIEAAAGATDRLNDGIKTTSDGLGKKIPAAAGAAKAQFNGLANSVNQISRELPAFTFSAQTGFLAISNNIPILVDEINRLKIANAAAAASGAATIPIWTAIKAAIFSWGTILSILITVITVFGKEIGGFISGLFKTTDALDETTRAQEAMSEAFKSSEVQNAIEDVISLKANLELAKGGMLASKVVIDQYNESIGKAAGEVKTLDELETALVKNADKFIQATIYKAAALKAQEDIAKELAESAKTQLEAEEGLIKAQADLDSQKGQPERLSGTGATSNLTNLKQGVNNLKKEVEDGQKAIDDLTQSGTKLVQKLRTMSLGTGVNLFDETDDPEEAKAVTDGRQALLDKVAALDAEYARKSFTKDEEEIQALKDKFARVRELVDRFNNDPKNKAKRIDVTGLAETENRALGDLTFRQDTTALGKEIADQKRVFEEFEAFKMRFGIQAARDQYAGQLGEYENFIGYLRGLVDKNADTYEAVVTGTATGGQAERYALLEKAAQTENAVQLEKYGKLLEQNRTFHDTLRLMEEKYEAARLILLSAGKTQEAEALRQRYELEVSVLEDANLKKSAAYKNLFQDIQRMTVRNARILVAEADRLLATERMSAEESIKIQEKRADLLQLINRETLEDIYRITGALGALGESLADLGGGALSEIGGLMSGLASGVNDLLVSFDKDASDIDKVVAGINGLIKIIGMLSSAAKKRRDDEADYYRALIGYQNEYNLSLNEQIRLQSILGESVFIKDFEGKIKSGLAALTNANGEFQKAIEKLSDGRAKSGQRNAIDWKNVGAGVGSGAAIGATIGSVVPVIGNIVGAVVGGIVGGIAGLLGGKKKKDQMIPLLDEYPELLITTAEGVKSVNLELAKSLISNNLVDDATKQILQNVIDWGEALEAARKQIKEVVSELAGSLGSDLRNALVDAFKKGESAALAMGATVEKVLEDILSQLIFNRIFADVFKQLEEDMIKSSDLGGDGNWIDDFERFFKTAESLGGDFNQAMTDAMKSAEAAGFNIFKSADSTAQRGLAGAIRRELTEATGSELAGLFRGFYDITKRSFALDQSRFILEQKHFENSVETMQMTAMIEYNTATTVEELRLAVTELKTISKNTKPGGGLRDLGIDD